MTVTISGDVASEIDKIARKKKSPRSQVMEEIFRRIIERSLKTKPVEKS